MVNYKLTENPILKGDIKNTPKKDSNTIRIFISSTFTDMTEERNALMRTTFPELQSYFRSKGFDFEVVDMRWGVREEMVLDHMASQLCQEQIQLAQNISQGVCFIALLGDKYGSCPLPYSLPIEHYKLFTELLTKSKIKHDVLEKWYLLDENERGENNEAVYVLAPLTERFLYINSKDPAHVEQRFQEKREWEEDQVALRTILQKAATLSLQEGRFQNETEKDLYFMAVTEREITNGILADDKAPIRALCFMRTFEHFRESDAAAPRYADIINAKADPSSKIYLRKLKTKKIPECLPKENIFQYTIPWHEKGVCAEEENLHKIYLDRLCGDLKRAVIELSEKRMVVLQNKAWLGNSAVWHSDLLHHAEFCRNRVETFIKRRKLRERCLKALIKNQFPLPQQYSKDFSKKGKHNDDTTDHAQFQLLVEKHANQNIDPLINNNEALNGTANEKESDDILEEKENGEVLNEKESSEILERKATDDENENENEENLNNAEKEEKQSNADSAMEDISDNEIKSDSENEYFHSSSSDEFEHKDKKFFKSNRKFVSTKPFLEKPNAMFAHKPVIIYGISGCGKTSFLSHMIYNFEFYFNRFISACPNNRKPILEVNCIKIIRYLGTSPLSCTVRDLLQSIIMQIWFAFDCEPEESKKILSSSFSSLVAYFERLLWSYKNYKGTIIIALDAVDQLVPDDGAYNLNWLPLSLPSNIFFIISMYESTEMLNDSSAICLTNVKKMIPDQKCYVYVTGMDLTSRDDIEAFLRIKKRTFTPFQKNCIYMAFKERQHAMCLKLLFDLSKDWKSFTDVSNIKFGKTAKDLIQQLFSKLETQHGKTLIYSLKYLAAARNGLTNSEMEDLLSLEDRVLQDVYVYHLPAESQIIRLPPMLWRSVRQQLNDYLTEKEADGKTLISWYHRQFWETGKYHSTNNIGVHTTMAEYFSGEWHDTAKPLILFKGKKCEYPDCIRNVPLMPYEFSSTEPNLRKLNELPYHLILSYQMEKAEDLLTSFDFLLCKLQWMGLKHVLSDFRLFFATFSPFAFDRADLAYIKAVKENQIVINMSEFIDDRSDIIEMKIVLEILVNAADAIILSHTNLAGQILGRLGKDLLEYPRIKKLHRNAALWAANVSLPLMLPRFTCLQQPGSLLKTTIQNVMHVPRRYRDYRCGFFCNGQYLYAREQQWDSKDVIQVFDLNNFGEQIQTIKLHADLITMTVLKSEKFVIANTFVKSRNYKSENVQIFNLQTRENKKLPLANNPLIKHIILANSETFFVALYCKEKFSIFDIDSTTDTILLRNTVNIDTDSNYECGNFNVDDTTIVFATQNGFITAYSVIDSNFMWSSSVLYVDNIEEYPSFGTLKFHFTSNRKIVCRGLKPNWHKLYILHELTGEILHTFEAGNHPLDIIIMHKSEQWVACATSTGTVDTTSYDNSKSKPLFLYDIEEGRLLERIKGNRGAYKSAVFLGDDHEYVAFSRQYDPGIIIVFIGTPLKPYQRGGQRGQQMMKLNGHVKAVTCFVKDPLDHLLISASDDNHIKVWDLQTILIICKLYWNNPNGQQKRIEKRKNDVIDEQNNADKYTLFSGNLSESLEKKLMGGCHAYVIAISSNKNYVATGCLFGRIVFFTLNTGHFVVTQGHSTQVKRVNKILFSSLNLGVENVDEFLVSAALEPVIRFWNPSNGQCIKMLSTDVKVSDIALHDDFIYVGGSKEAESSLIQKYILTTGEKIMEFSVNNEFAFSDFVVVPSHNVICSWNAKKVSVFDEAISPDDNKLLTLSERQFMMNDAMNFFVKYDKCGFIKASKDSRYVLCGTVRYLHIIFLAAVEKNIGYDGVLDCGSNVNCVDFTENCHFALLGCYRKVRILDLLGTAFIRDIKLHADYIENIVLCPNTGHMITLSKDKLLSLHEFSQKDLTIGETVSSFVFHCPVRHMAVPDDMSYVLVGPESAAPLALIMFNDFLVEKLKESFPSYISIFNWSDVVAMDMNDLDEIIKDTTPKKVDSKIDVVFNEDYADVYVGENKSLSISLRDIEICKFIVNPFSSSTDSSKSPSSCSIS